MKYDDNGDDGNDSNDGENHDYENILWSKLLTTSKKNIA